MTGIICSLSEDINRALKAYAREHGNISKSKAATQLIEEWLTERGYLYLDPVIGEGYENLEDSASDE